MVYDALEYARQVAEKAKKHKENNDTKGISSGEFMRGFHKDDRLVPVVTLVIFFNPEKWDGSKSIHEMFDVKDKRLLSYVNDYKINLISPYEITEANASKFQSNLKEVLLYIKNSNDKNKLQELVNGDKKFTNLDRDAACVINACTNSKLKINENDEVIDVCKAINDLVIDSKAEGKAEGIDEGKIIGTIDTYRELGKKQEDAEKKIMSKFALTTEDANEYIVKYW
ncbi:MAG: transposase, partial [Firmicutes bacterium]|nr:transposase [Bacillota bacterium]